MPRITGVTGDAVISADPWNAMLINVKSWSGDLVQDEHDADELGDTDTGHKSYMGMHRMSGTISGDLDSAKNALVADFIPGVVTSSLVLTASTGITYTFEAHMTSLGLNVAKSPLNTYTWNFVSDGDVVSAQPA